MPNDPDPPPAKKFKPGSAFFRLDRNKPGMLLPRKGNAATAIDLQRKQLPIYQAKPQLQNQLRQLHNAVLIGTITHSHTRTCRISSRKWILAENWKHWLVLQVKLSPSYLVPLARMC